MATRHRRPWQSTLSIPIVDTHRSDIVEALNLWQSELPEFNGATLEAKYAVAHGLPHSPEQVHAWKGVARIADHFKSADKYLVSLPMWNFGIPYKLKHYIDLLVQPGLTFGFTQDGTRYKGLITGKPMVIIYARGGAYGPGSGAEAADHQSHLSQSRSLVSSGSPTSRKFLLSRRSAIQMPGKKPSPRANRKAAEIAAHF